MEPGGVYQHHQGRGLRIQGWYRTVQVQNSNRHGSEVSGNFHDSRGNPEKNQSFCTNQLSKLVQWTLAARPR